MIPFLLAFDTQEETDKFERIYIKTNRILFGYAFSILENKELAEDAVHDAFVRLSHNLNKIDDPECKKSINYMITIVKNVSLSMLSQAKRQQNEYFDEEDEAAASDELSPLDYSTRKESYALLHDAVKMLSDSYRSIIELKYYNDLSQSEIADILKISENNVSVRLYRAQEQLQKNLRKLEVLTNE
ncbi:MAG: sigma-70 family RNA polymerase sigma factor [Angelakisella sp.]